MQKTMLVLLLFCGMTLSAQQRKWDRPMQLKRCLVDIKADPFTATTFIEMEFFNPNDQDMEGLHQFTLQPGQAITGFQLDLQGQYRDGSIEEKGKATNAYNTIVGKRIDPALLTMDAINSYSLRIFPVPARGSRRISMTIQQLMTPGKNTLDYLLPMNIRDTVSVFDVKITVNNSPEKAFIRDGFLFGNVFWGKDPSWLFHTSYRQVLLNKPLSFHIPLNGETVYCTSLKDNKTHFALSCKPAASTKYSINPKKITVFWDASASGNKRDIQKEISFLKQYIAYHQISQVTIIPFSFRILDTAVFYTGQNFNSRWDQYLNRIQYDGATQLGILPLAAIKDDVILLFSDGINSYGKETTTEASTYVYCITSSRSDQIHLQKIIGSSGGEIIDLQKLKASEAIAIANKAENILMDVRSASGKTLIDHQQFDRTLGRLSISGMLYENSDTLFFAYGNNSRITSVEKVFIDGRISCQSTGLERMEELSRFNATIQSGEWDKVLAFGKKERMVTPYTAYIVLERIEDYVRYNIEPPKDIEAECIRAGYVKRDRSAEIQKISSEQRILHTVSLYNNRVHRWNMTGLQPGDIKPTLADIYHGPGIPDRNKVITEKQDMAPAPSEMQEVVVIGYAASRRKDITGSVTSVRSDNLFKSGYSSVEQVLQGRVAGVSVTPSESFTGRTGSIRIRGINSLNSSSEPLYVIDGVPVNGNINDLVALNDIETITVVKDASAMALYGTRGSNGVIVIDLKKGNRYRYSYFNNRPYRLKDMEDVDYLQELKAVPASEKLIRYRELQQEYGDLPGFYLDVAEHLYEIGKKKEALAVLSNAAEVSHGNLQVLKAIGFILDSWKEYDEAIRIFEYIKSSAPDLLSYRNLAMAYESRGRHQDAVNTLYEGISKDWEQNEPNLYYLKELLLNDLNIIVSRHRNRIDTMSIKNAMVKPLPVDLRIVIDGNTNGSYNFCVSHGQDEVCNNRMDMKQAFFTTGLYGIAEYQMKTAKEGKYKIKGRFYHSGNAPVKTPNVLRVTVYKNFGRPDQTVQVQTVIMDNQNGEVEFAEIKW